MNILEIFIIVVDKKKRRKTVNAMCNSLVIHSGLSLARAHAINSLRTQRGDARRDALTAPSFFSTAMRIMLHISLDARVDSITNELRIFAE